MPLEPDVGGIEDLNEAWPLGSDLLIPGDETAQHLRNVKRAWRGSFTGLATHGGVVTISAAEFNSLAGATGNIQQQLDVLPVFPSWTRPLADSEVGPIENWILVPNTRILIQNSAFNRLVYCTLPSNTGPSDGDVIEVKAMARDSSALPLSDPSTVFRLDAFSGETFRLWNDPTDAWVTASYFSITNFDPWPHVQCVFSSDYNGWVVSVLNNTVETFGLTP